MRFRDRREAGQVLAERLRYLRGHNPVVVALPRGGVPVAAEVAHELRVSVNVLPVRKVTVPDHPETAIGAVAEGAVTVTERETVRQLGLTPAKVSRAAARARAELITSASKFQRGRAPVLVTGRIVVLVDDGIASGATALAAIRVLRARGALAIVLAVPVAPTRVLDRLARKVDQIICPLPIRWLHSVGGWYQDFTPVTDEEVLALLDSSTGTPAGHR